VLLLLLLLLLLPPLLLPLESMHASVFGNADRRLIKARKRFDSTTRHRHVYKWRIVDDVGRSVTAKINLKLRRRRPRRRIARLLKNAGSLSPDR
jgi:hypothetical protein